MRHRERRAAYVDAIARLQGRTGGEPRRDPDFRIFHSAPVRTPSPGRVGEARIDRVGDGDARRIGGGVSRGCRPGDRRRGIAFEK